LLTEIVDDRLPPRRDRSNPRVIKRKMSNFKLKRPKHAKPSKPRPTAETIRILWDR
jgi:hypothetical protein